TITIEVLAKESGVDARSILDFQRQGLVPRAHRVAAGLLLYRTEDIERLLFIRRAIELGFSVDSVRELLGLASKKPQACADVHEIASRHLADVRRRMAKLARPESMLAPWVASCSGGRRLEACPILSSLSHRGAVEAAARARKAPG